jgi:hypothetical protein
VHAPVTPNAPVVAAIETVLKSNRSVQVEEVKLDSEGLLIQVASLDWTARLSFESFYGFRVLDELDLTEFWSVCSLQDGWLYEVISGGWKELELSRPAFISGRHEWTKEYLVVGFNECVSVLSKDRPLVSASQPSNPFVKGTSCGKPQAAPYVER